MRNNFAHNPLIYLQFGNLKKYWNARFNDVSKDVELPLPISSDYYDYLFTSNLFCLFFFFRETPVTHYGMASTQTIYICFLLVLSLVAFGKIVLF